MKKLVIFTFVIFAFLFAMPALAVENFNFLRFFNTQTFTQDKEIALPASLALWNLSAIDLGGDGTFEILAGSPSGVKTTVKILRSDGSKINEFSPYDKNFKGGVSVASCNLDNDGQSEIITGPASDGGPHIRVFDGYGKEKVNTGFFAGDKNKKMETSVGCADINGDKKDEIVVVAGEPYNQKMIGIFDASGNKIAQVKTDLVGRGIKISKVDLGGDGTDEILVSGGYLDGLKLRIYRGDLSLLSGFLNNDSNLKDGASAIGADIDGDGKSEVISFAGSLLRPSVKIFDGYGNEKNSFMAWNEDFLGGVSGLVADFNGDGKKEILVTPKRLVTGRTDLGKYIEVTLSTQNFKYFDQGIMLGEFLTSTGKPSTQTRQGTFTAFSKYEMAYGGISGQTWGMPYFIGFYKSGATENGIHELPFLNGLREGNGDLGHAVSHGCVRLGIGPAKEVFNWVEINKTKVWVHR